MAGLKNGRDAPLRTVGFVNKRAISAGALIGLATQTLVMASGSTIGAAAPVQTSMRAGQSGTNRFECKATHRCF